eukprot:10518052-Lingulodinium_polyedra.AAC.1
MPKRMGDCVIRLMTPAKTCFTTLKTLSQCVVKFTWQEGPWRVLHIMSPYFSVGSALNDST